jgi:ABC-type transport system involved in multi-copper enzyme maturation permease subunit
MKNILLLMRKDLWQQRRFVLALLALELLGGASLFVQLRGKGTVPAAVTLAVLMLLAYVGPFMICYRTMLAEEKNRALLLLKTLPLDNRQLVLAKIGANFLLSIANAAAMLLYYGVAGRWAFLPALVAYLGAYFNLLSTVLLAGVAAMVWATEVLFSRRRTFG